MSNTYKVIICKHPVSASKCTPLPCAVVLVEYFGKQRYTQKISGSGLPACTVNFPIHYMHGETLDCEPRDSVCE